MWQEGPARQGVARRGTARHGKERQGKEQDSSGLTVHEDVRIEGH